MKRYYKEKENGLKIWFSGVLKYDGRQIINPSEEQLLAAGYVEYVPPTPEAPTEEELLAEAKSNKLAELNNYDNSSEVNDCIIVYQGEELHYWASKTERNDLKNAVRDCVAMGRDTYRLDLRDKGISITLLCELLLQMMAALEVYAIDCFNKTTDHRFAIEACKTEGEVDAYEFRGVGYPAKCRFEV